VCASRAEHGTTRGSRAVHRIVVAGAEGGFAGDLHGGIESTASNGLDGGTGRRVGNVGGGRLTPKELWGASYGWRSPDNVFTRRDAHVTAFADDLESLRRLR
jgi:hypothetical protein